MKMPARIAMVVLIFVIASFSTRSDHKVLDVRYSFASISEIRSPAPLAPKRVSTESLKRKSSKEKANFFPEKLARDARWLAQHGGVTGTCHGCATARMKQLVRALIVARFAPAGASATQTVLCIVEKESDFNPGEISDTDDWGVGQINRPTHEPGHSLWWRPHAGFKYAVFDPVYNVGIIWSMSKRGVSWTPWTGTYGRGMCH